MGLNGAVQNSNREVEQINDAGEATPIASQSDQERVLEHILARVPPVISLPKAGQKCPYTTKPRTFLVELIAPCKRNGFKPPVKAIYKKAHRHAQRGIWLIPSENLFRYLLDLAQGSAQVFNETREERTQGPGRASNRQRETSH